MAPLVWPDRWPAWGPVVLRPWSDGDLAVVADLARDPYVPLIGTVPTPCTEEGARAYVARQHRRLAEGAGWSFAVTVAGTDVAVGQAGLWLHADRPASAGYAVGPSQRGRGYAVAALRALVGFARTLGLPSVELFVEPGNLASAAVVRRAGGRCVQRLPRHVEIAGVRRDMDRWVVVPGDAPDRPPAGPPP